MKILVLSDIHAEFQRDRGIQFIQSLDPTGVDVLVVAGDLGTFEVLEDLLSLACRLFPEVVFVTGNHEHYRRSNKEKPADFNMLQKRLKANFPNLHWLDRKIWVHQGVRFLGATLWFPDDPKTAGIRHSWSDFVYIPRLSEWVFKENSKTVSWLTRELRPKDVVVTHHLPSYACVAKEFVGAATNGFFATELSNLILDRNPAVWMFGHTHTSADWLLGETRMVCNPFGYDRLGLLNPEFDLKKIIEV